MYGKCWLCGKVGAVERHHIFGGSNRDKSERDGLVVLGKIEKLSYRPKG